MVFCRPTASGSTPPGKKTLLRSGRMGRTEGMSSLLMSPGAAGVTTLPFSDISFLPVLGKLVPRVYREVANVATAEGLAIAPCRRAGTQAAAALTARRAVQTLPANRMRSISKLTLLALLSACQSYVAVPVQPVTLVAVSQRNKVRVFTKADVLLVIDDSFSMSGKQQRLAAALQNFTGQLDALAPPVDYQVAVTTTTVSERLGACGPPGDAAAAASCDSEWQARGVS